MRPGARESRLDAIAGGRAVDSHFHDAAIHMDAVLDIDRFSLWYGKKQALFNITLGIPRARSPP